MLQKNKSNKIEESPQLNDFTQLGLLEWDKSKDMVTMCPLLAETLAFSTHDTTQSLNEYRKLIHPDDLETIEIIKKKIKETEEEYIVTESRRKCRDGTWRWFNFRGKILETDKNGDPIRGFGTCIDVTSFKEIEAEFQQIKLLLSEIKHIKECHKRDEIAYDSTSYVHVYTHAFVCSEILKSLEKITQSSCSMFIFSFTHTFNTKELNQQKLYDHNGKAINNLLLNPEKLDFIKKLQLTKNHIIQNGKETALLGIYLDLPFEQHGMIILEQNVPFENTLLDFIEPFINIARHLISFENLDINYKELDNITSYFIKQVPTPVAMFDANICYKFASNEWCSLFKLGAPSELTGKTMYDVYPQQPKEWRELYLRGLAGDSFSCKAEKISGLFDEPIWIEWGIHPWYTLNKAVGGIFVYANIITERIEFEENIQNAIDNLTQSNQALKSFAHVCSHDLKEPLRSISNFIQLLFNKNAEHFDDESLLYMRHTIKGIEHMNILIKDVLAYSEIINHVPHKNLPFNMTDIALEIKELLNYKFSEIGAQLNIGTLPVILGNKTQINQLLTNLISNAIKFRSSNPLAIEIFAVDADCSWEFHVRDNGIGIAPEYHESIFTVFKRLHSKNKYEGSGIGLAICKRIVNDHHGKIYIQSPPEGGSDFIFTLPKTNIQVHF